MEKNGYKVSKKTNLKIPPQNTNVSLQKYITKVQHQNGTVIFNGGNARSNKGGSYSNNIQISKSSKDDGSMYKSNFPVQIEAGDLVTYKICVYNNSSIDAEYVEIKDILPGNTTLISCNKDCIQGENNDLTIGFFNIEGKKSAECNITLKFEKYDTNQLWNVAKIVATKPDNETSYRTQDGDSIKMKTYAVSLEKYISQINGENLETGIIYPNILNYLSNNYNSNYYAGMNYLISHADINKDGKVNDVDLNLLQEYIDSDITKKISDMNISKIDEWKNSDINGDGQVDNQDREIYLILLGRNNLEPQIEQFLKLDINNDGDVNSLDRSCYKGMLLDIDENKVMDDIVDETIAAIYSKKIDRNTLSQIKMGYINSLDNSYNTSLKKLYKYAISEINQDGKIEQIDIDFFKSEYWKNNIKILEYCKSTDINEKENLINLNKSQISEIKNIIEEFDKNGDGRIDNKDIIYNGENDLAIQQVINENDIDGNGSIESYATYTTITYTDGTVKSADEAFGDIVFTEEELNKEIDHITTSISGDILTLEKENLIIEYITILKNEKKISDNTLVIDFNIEELYESINNDQYYIYDLNSDEKIDDDDINTYINNNSSQKLIENSNYTIHKIQNIDEYIKEYGDILFDKLNEISKEGNFNGKTYDEIYATNINFTNIDEKTDEAVTELTEDLDFNNDGRIDNEDYKNWKELDLNEDKMINDTDNEIYTHFINTLELMRNYIVLNSEEQAFSYSYEQCIQELEMIQNIWYEYKNLGNASILEEDYKIIKQSLTNQDKLILLGKNWINYNKSLLDVDGDGFISQDDLELLESYSQYRETCSNTDITIIEELIGCDINGDGNFNLTDYNIIKNYLNNREIDLNEDGKIDNYDAQLLSEVIIVANKSESERAKIVTYMQNTSADKRWNRAEHKYDNNINTIDNWKSKNVLTVQSGSEVTYTITVKNDSCDTSIYISEILDTLSTNLTFVSGINSITIDGVQGKITRLAGILLAPGASASCQVTVKVTKPNIFIDVIKNTATINKITNINGINVNDTTSNNNTDSDYIQLPDIIIKGNVWNDKVVNNKEQNKYNAIYDEGLENKLSGINVYLYREGKGIVAETKTVNGEYLFSSVDSGNILTNYIKGPKNSLDNDSGWLGSKISGDYNGIVKGGYYSYYIIFEYDGVTYTSTPDGEICVDITDSTAYNNDQYKINSNAKEDNGPVKETRKSFNSKFGKITEGEAQYDDKNDTKSMDIYYNTRNETGYIPQSNHKSYDSNGNLLEGYKIQSSTNLIQLSNKADLEEQLQYVNLGLRGRDIFDLELTSDVSKVEVTVNNKQGVYNYTNKVTIRDADVRKQNIENGEDMANITRETSNNYVEDRDGEEGQQLNNTDLNISSDYTHTNRNNYDDTQGLQDIKVTYKITVTNASQTNGIATVITDYYDKCYTNPTSAYVEIDKNGNGEIEEKEKGSFTINPKYIYESDGGKYNKVELHVKEAIKEILGQDGMLTQSQSYNLYFTLRMTDQGIDNLKTLFKDKETLKYPTYNMAEIRKYKTACGENQTEYTRGLIDKDSAPGSAEKTEKVRLTTTESNITQETEGNPSTVEYYFSKRTDDKVDLSKLKYEDDTYATPTLYFTSNTRERKIEGTVFEDYTEIINNNDDNELVRTKTGNGIQDGDEPGINGATVELIELVKVSEDETKEEIRYSTTTDYKNKESKEGAGYYSFSGYLPGNYIIRYRYGDTEKTFTYNNNPNTKSYNGEDFQSTNNIGAYGAKALKGYNAETSKFENTTDWYAYNEKEGVSTATDNRQRRIDVSTSVTDFSDEEMTVLNNVRDGKNMDAAKVTYKENDTEKEVTAETIKDATKMFATTPAMELTMEETVQNGNETKQNDSFIDYIVSNMNFGIAEVPVTTIDLQKHVYSLKISDSTGDNIIAEAQIDTNNAQVTVNPSKIAENKLDVVINVLSKDLGMDKSIIRNLIGYDENKGKDTNIIIAPNANKEQTEKLQYDMTMYSLAREITITKTWNVKSENVLAAPGTSILDISIEDDKLQGAKLEVTYEITASIYAERNFNNDAVVEPTIKGIADYIDNDLSYNEEKIGTQPQSNKEYWTIAKQEELAELYKRAEQIGETQGSENIQRSGTLDPDGIKYTTIVTANNIENGLLVERCGTGTAYITLERVLSSTDSSIGDIIQSSIDTYEYDNNLEITGLDYENEGDFIFRDRVRTADRYIILAGRQHDTATSETIAIHPPTGENNSMNHYIIALISLGILATGIILIKKYAIKKDNK